jgi:hypothetical protein
MKRCVCVLACLLLLASGTTALADAPNPRQSITYFMNFFNESVVQASTATDMLEKGKSDPGYPYCAKYLFYTELMNRIEKTMTLALNLCDIYHLYSKTTYCFTKDEKTYLFDRIDNILQVLQRLMENPYTTGDNFQEGDKEKINEQQSVFNERVRKLRAFIRSSLPAFQR